MQEKNQATQACEYLPVAEEEVGELALVDLDLVVPVLRSGSRLGQAARAHGGVGKHHGGHVCVVSLRCNEGEGARRAGVVELFGLFFCGRELSMRALPTAG